VSNERKENRLEKIVLPDRFVQWDEVITLNDYAGKTRVGVLKPEKRKYPPVIMVHGFSSASQIWGFLASELKKHGFEIYAIDLPGHGNSDAPEDVIYDFSLFNHYLDLLYEEIGENKVAIAGHSMGGAIVMNYVYKRLEKITGLILFSTALKFWQRIPVFVSRLIPNDFLQMSKERLLRLFYNLWRTQNEEQWMLDYIVEISMATPPYVLKSTYEEIILKWDGFDIAPKIRRPAIVGVGTMDIVTPPSLVRTVAQALPFGVFRHFTKSSHHVLIDKPMELSRYVLAFAPAIFNLYPDL